MKNFFIRTVISLGFLGVLFYLMRDDFPAIVQSLKSVDRPLFAAAMVIYLTTILILAARLQIIFRAEGTPIGYPNAANLTFVGFFFNNFLPTSVGGDIVKAMCAARVTGEPVKSVTCVLMDRIFGLFTFILIPSVSVLFFMKSMKNPLVPVIIYSFLAGAALFFMLIFNRGLARRFRFFETVLKWMRLDTKVRKVYDGLNNFRNHKGVMFQALSLSLVGQSINIFVLYLMARALGSSTPPVYFYMLVPIVHLISMLPSLNGLGIREGAYVYFLGPYVGRETAAAIGIFWLGLLFLSSIAGGIIYLVRHDYHIRFSKAASGGGQAA